MKARNRNDEAVLWASLAGLIGAVLIAGVCHAGPRIIVTMDSSIQPHRPETRVVYTGTTPQLWVWTEESGTAYTNLGGYGCYLLMGTNDQWTTNPVRVAGSPYTNGYMTFTIPASNLTTAGSRLLDAVMTNATETNVWGRLILDVRRMQGP